MEINMVEVVQIKEVLEREAQFEAGNGFVTLYEGMPDDVILKFINCALRSAKGAAFTVQQLPDWNEDLEAIEKNKTTTDEGFSNRLNQLIDMTDLQIPPLDYGRAAFIAELFKVSKNAAGIWLKKNTPPKASALEKLVMFLVSHIKTNHHHKKIEAWLVYGDEVVKNPFN